MKSVDAHLSDLRSLLPAGEAEDLSPQRALGRTLAADVIAPSLVPAFATSAMDGFAVRVGDVPGSLRIAGEVPAGSVPDVVVESGQAVRIMTGSPLPDGTEAVVRVEDTTESGGFVEVRVGVRRGQSVRLAGEDLRPGDLVLPAGSALGAAQLAALVAFPRLSVRTPRTVAVMSTGDELVAPGIAPGPAQLVDSNGPGLAAAAAAAGADVVHVGHVGDDPQRFLDALDALPPSDLVITSGGISMGAYDVVKAALSHRGVVFEQVAVQPGMPQAWGRLSDGRAFLGLPGNPVSALVCFELFGRAVLRRERPWLTTTLREPVDRSPAGKLQLRRGRYVPGGVALEGGPGSHLVSGLARADCLIAVPPESQSLDAGAPVEILPLRLG